MNVKKTALVVAFAGTRRVRTMPVIKDTAKTRNLLVELPHSKIALSVDDMEAHLRSTGSDMGLYVSHITTLGRKRYPGNRHWHLKQHPKEPGCLDVTYWPARPMMWISMRKNEPQWVQEAGPELQRRIEEALTEE